MKNLQELKEAYKRFKRRNAIRKEMRKGAKYLLNVATMELHDLKNEQKNCHLSLITHPLFIKPDHLQYLLKTNVDGCRFCMPKFNNG